MTERRDHYSYTVYAEPSTARRFDQQRFGGPVGQLVGAREAEAIARFARPVSGCTVLDVGTGTGRIALFLAQAGAAVTGLDASEEMLTVGRERAAAQHAAKHNMSVRQLEGHSQRMVEGKNPKPIEEIKQAKAKYFRGVDTSDGPLVRSILADDCLLLGRARPNEIANNNETSGDTDAGFQRNPRLEPRDR